MSQNSLAAEDSSQQEELHLEVTHDGPPLSLVMPAESLILKEALRLVSNKNISVRDLAACISQDPILLLEILRLANSTLFSQDRPPTTIAENAVVQLGSAKVIEVINELSARPYPSDALVVKEFERLRSRARRASIVARILAMSTTKPLAAEAQTVALVSNLGHMIACLYFGNSYAKLAAKVSRGTLAYRMLHEQSFNVHRIQMAYLRRQGFPEILMFALDRELSCKTPYRMPLRHIAEAASELVDAFDADKWGRYSPSRELPNNSALRFLTLEVNQYAKVYERLGEYLSLARQETEQAQLNPNGIASQGRQIEKPSAETTTPVGLTPASEEALSEELSGSRSVRPSVVQFEPEQTFNYSSSLSLNDSGSIFTESHKPQGESRPPAPGASFPSRELNQTQGTFLFPAIPPRTFEEAADFSAQDKPRVSSSAAKRALSALSELVENVGKTQDLLEELLQLLISEGPFVRSGIFVVSENGRSARLLRALGGDLEAGKEIVFSDPLCPLSACLNQIRSFNTQGMPDLAAPLGVSAYAVSPLNVDHPTPVFLYADCGDDGSMSFESRRLFRYVVGLLNQILPSMEPGLPN